MVTTRSKRLLILSCGKTKDPLAKPMWALGRYQGAAFRIVKKYLRETFPSPSDNLRESYDKSDLHILILSGYYGLICATDPHKGVLREAEFHLTFTLLTFLNTKENQRPLWPAATRELSL